MELTEAEVDAQIANGQIGAVSLDTSTFVKHRRQLESGLLARLNRLADAGLALLLSDIVTRELQGQMNVATRTSLSRTKEGISTLRHSLADPDPALSRAFDLVDQYDAAQLVGERLQRFIAATNAIIVPTVGSADLQEVLRRYFSREAPFGDGEKRKEFPDAFALLALENWSNAHDTSVLVLSTDKDWRKYCASSPRLVCVQELAKALSWVEGRIVQGNAMRNAADRLIEALTDEGSETLLRALEVYLDEQSYKIRLDAIADSVFFAAPDLVVDGLEIDDLAIARNGIGIEPLGYSQGELTVALTVPCKLEVSGVVVFNMRDPIDKDVIRMGSDGVSRMEEADVEAIARFVANQAGEWVIAGVELEPASIHMDLGHITPDWSTGGDGE